MTNVAGINNTRSQKASDMFVKTRYITDLNHGRGVIFATGTPISNSMAVRP
jgi:N12 class adenine-specific DNA methylase